MIRGPFSCRSETKNHKVQKVRLGPGRASFYDFGVLGDAYSPEIWLSAISQD